MTAVTNCNETGDTSALFGAEWGGVESLGCLENLGNLENLVLLWSFLKLLKLLKLLKFLKLSFAPTPIRAPICRQKGIDATLAEGRGDGTY